MAGIALTPFVLVSFLLCGYVHYWMHPLLNPLIDRKEARYLYTAMIVKGMVFVVVSAAIFNFIKQETSLETAPSSWTHFILNFINSVVTPLTPDFSAPEESFSFLAFLSPLLVVLAFNFSRISYWRYKKNPMLCIWRASGTLERWVIEESKQILTLERTPNSRSDSIKQRRLSRVVLKNDKVYIGIVLSVDNDNGGITHVHLAPLYSGYIDERKELRIVERYADYYRKLISEIRNSAPQLDETELYGDLFREFAVTLCMDEVITVSSYSPKEHSEFNKLKRSFSQTESVSVNIAS
ncbi:hypothetical protein IDAT_12845 [Pseudidiomarina atlantica]|uniref:Uncharacterized protein n=1 Tax=Pseudidiomarina atlantica TaxID=1517416 RepID=A0A094KZN8_9GAMM|nr:hypothetical protein [Pseudidiomarina atlantica]KFZ27773.1 hypothetical protein IDAT_12845 [Pseudidiomarina atlantica]